MACANICCGVSNALKGQRYTPVYVSVGLDIWRYITHGKGVDSEHRGHVLFEKGDFSRLRHLPENWWYQFNTDGDGAAIDFPLKAKPVLSWSPKKFIKTSGNLVEAPRFPIKKICLTVIRKAYTADSL